MVYECLDHRTAEALARELGKCDGACSQSRDQRGLFWGAVWRALGETLSARGEAQPGLSCFSLGLAATFPRRQSQWHDLTDGMLVVARRPAEQ